MAAPKQKVSNISIESAEIGFRNFSGKEGQYNPPGNRNFAVFLETDLAETLEKDGWNVRWLDPKDEGEPRQPILSVKLGFTGYAPPSVTLISNDQQTQLDEGSVSLLDWADIDNVDLVIRPYHYDVNGRQGIKAYLRAMYVTIVPDVFAEKYQAAPDSGQSCTMQEDGTCI